MLFEKGQTILFIGDSISDYERSRPVGEGLFNAWGRSYVADVGSLLGCMYPELQLRITNMGISGNQARDLERRWETDVMERKPDWVSVLIGINDVWRQFDTPAMLDYAVSTEDYEKNMRAMIESAQKVAKGVIVYTVLHGTEQGRFYACTYAGLCGYLRASCGRIRLYFR